MRLSYCYAEPDDLVEGVRRLATALRTARGRPARRAAVAI
jgi:DNA-binding transcriptional MocR family regulator